MYGQCGWLKEEDAYTYRLSDILYIPCLYRLYVGILRDCAMLKSVGVVGVRLGNITAT